MLFPDPGVGSGGAAPGGRGVITMHVIECPGCSSLLKVPKPVSNARVKCRKCGVVFSGTSREMPDRSPSHPAAAPAPRSTPAPVLSTPFRVTPKRGKNNVAVFATAGAAVVLIVLVVAVVWRVQHQAPPVQEQAPPPPPPVRAEPKPAPGPGSNLFPVSARPTPADEPGEAPKPKPSPKPVATAPAPVAPPAPVLPANLPVDCSLVKLGLPGSEDFYIRGSVRNDRNEGLKSATVEIRLPNGDKPPVVKKIVCSMLAPKSRSPFMVSSPVGPQDDASPTAVVVAVEPLAPKQVCWSVEGALVKGDETADTRTISGTVRNPMDVRVAKIEVYADVYFGDGRLAGSAKGKLEQGDMLDPSARGDFSLPFPSAGVGTRLQSPIVRAAGFVP